MLTQHDELVQRCPMLGHEVPFSYCRQPAQEIPCRKIFDCWFEKFDIKAFMAENFNEETIAEITKPPKAKVLSLLEIIEQARRNAQTPKVS